VFAPGGLPADITAKLHGAVQTVLREPEVLDRLQKMGMRPYPLSVADSRARILHDVKVTEDRLARGIVKPR
jgi:tripartite-type tricarboxylate transporter receptor subunit TctC